MLREEEYKAGKRDKEEENEGGRAVRKVNPAVKHKSLQKD